jgi:ParB family chromosome partitioning protein
VAEDIIRRNLTVRAAEKLVAHHFERNGATKPTRGSSHPAPAKAQPAVQHLENRLRQHLSTQVALTHGEKKGKIEIEYYGTDDLHRILPLLGLNVEE